jgi:hypothetical protein
MTDDRHPLDPWRGRMLAAGGALFALWISAGAFVRPYLVLEAYEGHGPAFLVARMAGRTTRPLEHYLDRWEKQYLSISAAVGIGLVVITAMMTSSFYLRFVHGPSARDLARIRIVAVGVLFVNAVWEDLASTAILTWRIPMPGSHLRSRNRSSIWQ